MNYESSCAAGPVRRGVAAAVLAVLCLTVATGNSTARGVYLADGQPDGVALLPPPPEPGSDEQAADLATARMVFKARTPEEETRANKDGNLSLFNFAPAIGPDFEPGRHPRLEALFGRVKKELSSPINASKNHWKRLRPYQVDPALNLGAKEPSPSYPSGHSTVGTVQALLLAELFPEKRAAILAFGREIGWDRVVLGKHFPTDVQAGRVLGQAIVRELMTSSAFRQDLEEARAEVRGQAAQAGAVKK